MMKNCINNHNIIQRIIKNLSENTNNSKFLLRFFLYSIYRKH